MFDEVAAERGHVAGDSPARLRHLLDVGGSAHFIAESDAACVGYLVSERREACHVSLGMAVARSWRGRGVGGALLRACIDWAGREGVPKLSLEVLADNEAALALYRKFDFVEEDRRSNVIVMSLHADRAD